MRFRTIAAILIACFAALVPAGSAMAFPPLPSSFYGRVSFNNLDVPDGTVVQALIDGQVYAVAYTMTYEGHSVYALNVLGDDSSTTIREGGREGDTIQFKIGGIAADQNGTWHSGVDAKLDLSAVSATPLATPQTTPTEPPTQTAIIQPTQATITASATQSGVQATTTARPPSLSANNATEYSLPAAVPTHPIPRTLRPSEPAATPIVVTQAPAETAWPTTAPHEVGGPGATMTPASAEEAGKSGSINIWLGAWAVVLLAAGAAWFFLRKK